MAEKAVRKFDSLCSGGAGSGLHAQLIDGCRDFHGNFGKQTAAPTRFTVQSVIKARGLVGEILFDFIKPSYHAAAKKHGTVPNDLFELAETRFKWLGWGVQVV